MKRWIVETESALVPGRWFGREIIEAPTWADARWAYAAMPRTSTEAKDPHDRRMRCTEITPLNKP